MLYKYYVMEYPGANVGINQTQSFLQAVFWAVTMGSRTDTMVNTVCSLHMKYYDDSLEKYPNYLQNLPLSSSYSHATAY